MKKLQRSIAAATLAAGVAAGGVVTMPASPANAAYPRGYVADGNLRAAPTTSSAVLARITGQSVEIICWTTGGSAGGTSKWFRAKYYSSTGYLSASVVSNQPSVGRCP